MTLIGYLDTRDETQKQIRRPSWTLEDGTPVEDAFLIESGILPLYSDPPTATPRHLYVETGFTVGEDRADVTWEQQERGLDVAKAMVCAQAREIFRTKIDTGYPYEGLRVEINDGSRANLGGLALTAALVGLGVPGAAWPEDYGRGWVSIEGERIPLTPQTAIPFASAAGAYYSALVQAEQDIENAVLAAEDHDALAAIDLTSGWPE